jgi:hypothetical protein
MNQSLSRIERYEIAIAQDRLSGHPRQQEDAIAEHYASLMSQSRDLYELARRRRYGPPNAEIDACIAHLVGVVKRAHLRAFGIPLEWSHESTFQPFTERSKSAFEPVGQTDPRCLTWQPMAIAPKDGSEILVLFDSATVDVVRLCWWDDGAPRESDRFPAPRPDDVGWWSYRHSVTQEQINIGKAVGWLPMPAKRGDR